MKKNKNPNAAIARVFAITLALSLGAGGVRAQGLAPASAFIAEGGVTEHKTYMLTAGVSWPLPWRHLSHTGEWTAHAELFASYWHAKSDDGRKSYAQVGLVPVLRYRFDQGRSDWFAEGGIGVSYFNGLYQRGDKRFSTRFNFYDTIGVGRSFGARRQHELSLRVGHVSNAGIKEPNPGENFFQLRYAHSF